MLRGSNDARCGPQMLRARSATSEPSPTIWDFGAAIILAIGSGLRRGEFLALRWALTSMLQPCA
jgi:integrase